MVSPTKKEAHMPFDLIEAKNIVLCNLITLFNEEKVESYDIVHTRTTGLLMEHFHDEDPECDWMGLAEDVLLELVIDCELAENGCALIRV
jgi:hypothetical protein